MSHASCPHCPECGALGIRWTVQPIGPLRFYGIDCPNQHSTTTNWRPCEPGAPMHPVTL